MLRTFLAASAILIGTSLGAGAAPVPPASLDLNPSLVEVKGGKHGRGGWKGNRGRHLGWYKGRHRGWAKQRARYRY
jgi:hypothetical protein